MRKYFLFIIVVCVFSGGITFAQSNETLTLDECIKMALKNNPMLKTAKFQYDIAKSDKLMSFARILPNISTSASVGKRTIGKSTDLRELPIYDPDTGDLIGSKLQPTAIPKYILESYSFSLNFQQTLFDGGAWWNQIKQGSANKNSFYYNLVDQTINTIALVKQRYYELLMALDNLDVLNEAIKVAEEQLARVQSMYEVGQSAQADVYRSKVLLGNEKINVIQQKRLVLLSRNNMNIALGRNISEPLDIVRKINIDREFNKSIDEVTDNVLENNFNLKSLEKGVKTAQHAASVTKGSKFPSLAYSLSYSRGNAARERVFTDRLDEDYVFSAYLGLNYTIFNGFQRKANINRSEKNYQINKTNYINNKRQILSDVKQRYNNIKSYQEMIDLNQDNIQSAQEDLRYAQERYSIGSGTLLEVNDAQVNLRRARYGLVSSQYNLMIEKANLAARLGEIEEEYLEMIK
ncbi:TolC family protein [candidate division KSB1 bacterium]